MDGECSPDQADLESVIAGLVSGQYNNPVRIVAFNIDEHYCEDVSAEIAREIQRRADLNYEDVSSSAVDFVERYTRDRQLSLRLGLMPWHATFDEPVPISSGSYLNTLHDARKYILRLPAHVAR